MNANGALESGAADELDRLVDRGIASDALDEPELVDTETECGAHGRVEARDAAAADRLDGVVECPDALHRPVREPLGECPVPLVEPGRGSS